MRCLGDSTQLSKLALTTLLVLPLGCPAGDDGDSAGSLSTFGSQGETTTGDGDGDPATGDGDGDSGSASGDGDPTTTGDGDGDASMCGDGVVQMGEECDLGPDNSDTGQCTTSCLIATCGDGLVYEGFEDCDDGNQINTDDCISTCSLAACGDGYVHEGVEACDDGNDVEDDGCTSTCLTGVCGDGILQEGEQCDDGNDDTSDNCPACQLAFCGDGYLEAGIEVCDDGNDQSDDECISPLCIPASCGDGYTWAGTEECDDANEDSNDACIECVAATCGDGFQQVGVEDCDTDDFGGIDCNDVGDLYGDLACTDQCTIDDSVCVDDPCGGSGGFFYNDRCWIIGDDCNAVTACGNVGLVGTAGAQNGVAWDANVMQAVADGLGVGNGGDTGCCAVSGWYDPDADQIYTHNFGAAYYNYTCLSGDFPLTVCSVP